MHDKATLREQVWQSLRDHGVARFPGTRGRIPNFVGAEAAAARLADTIPWAQARHLKCNPDSPQRPVRHLALKQGKVVYMAVPKLAGDKPFIELAPRILGPENLWSASSIRGADRLGRRVAAADVPPIDLIVTGCVGVSSAGARLGKGGGYSDLEFAMLIELGLVSPDTPIVTTVHGCQVLPEGDIPMSPHDISLDLFCTPDGVHPCNRAFERPVGVDPAILPSEKIAAIPVLRERFSRG